MRKLAFSMRSTYLIFFMEAVAISVSTCTAPALHGQHSFMVFDYSMNKALGLGEFIRSNTFNVGGFDWSIRYYPDGANSRSKEYISVFLELMKQGAQNIGWAVSTYRMDNWTNMFN
ncbi:hypothetical protein E2562_032068 [Oryza meyeriana var. granulata]|uniref:MATH domain-containing protein n=1 Tax=Oryza meyeriana var. granulata TaxID=110450 RepID=A0A6G1CK04_9ORYZ|nr:hypothetical protein E2562_032068 [Oryza meyeriana var. granulata]